MKDKKLKKLIQKPLRFHHQDIHEELKEIKGMLTDVISQVQTLQQRVEGLRQQDAHVWVSEYDDDYLR